MPLFCSLKGHQNLQFGWEKTGFSIFTGLSFVLSFNKCYEVCWGFQEFYCYGGVLPALFAEFFDCILTHVNTGIRVALSFLFGILGRVFPALFLHFLLKGVSLAFLVVSLANVSAF